MRNLYLQTQLPTILYIAGYGRSGSTLLDVLLGDHPNFFGGGEISRAFMEIGNNQYCSCGVTYRLCAFWNGVIKKFSTYFPLKDFPVLNSITRMNESLSFLLNRKVAPLYIEAWGTLCNAIVQEHCGELKYIIDSSKSTRKTCLRPVILKRIGFNVIVIHLVRDPRSVMQSILKGSNQRIERGEYPHRFGGLIRGILSWLFANIWAETVLPLYNIPLMTIRYEDLISEPQREISRIERFIGQDLEEVKEKVIKGLSFAPGHGISGNRMRRQGSIKIKNQPPQHHNLPFRAKLLFLLLLPFARKYGYTMHETSRLNHLDVQK